MIITIVAAVVVAAAAAVIGFILGGIHRKKVAEKAIGDATEEAKRIVSNALTAAEAKKREVLIEAKDEIHRERTENEKEIQDRRAEVQRSERRLIQKEESLDKKLDALEKKENAITKRQQEADARLKEVDALKKSQFDLLEKISGFTKEQAKDYMLKQLEGDLDHEKAVRILEYKQRTKDESSATPSRDVPPTMWRRQRCPSSIFPTTR